MDNNITFTGQIHYTDKQKLQEKFKGILNPTTIWYHCPDKWKLTGYVNSGRIGGLNNPKRFEFQSVSEEPLTEYEQKNILKYLTPFPLEPSLYSPIHLYVEVNKIK